MTRKVVKVEGSAWTCDPHTPATLWPHPQAEHLQGDDSWAEASIVWWTERSRVLQSILCQFHCFCCFVVNVLTTFETTTQSWSETIQSGGIHWRGGPTYVFIVAAFIVLLHTVAT